MDGDDQFMQLALLEAEQALAERQFPCGCVLVRDGSVIARGRNRVYLDRDPTRHGEMVALGQAALVGGAAGAVAYVTVEPCLMCGGAFLQAGVKRVVYAADFRTAGRAPTETLLQHAGFAQALSWTRGVRAAPAEQLLERWADYKQRVLNEADGCEPGELAELLRRESLTSLHLDTWRGEREQHRGA